MDDTESAAALAIIQAWEWEGWSFDGLPVPKWRSLSDTINQLAFDGHAGSERAILDLLCAGNLMARGRYHWQAHRRGQGKYQQEGNEIIAPRWWEAMRDARDTFDFATAYVELSELGIGETDSYTWGWQSDAFTVAGQSGEQANWEADYHEERFSAWDITVYCPPAESGFAESDDTFPLEDDDCQPSKPSVPTMAHKRGRPPKYDWEGALAHVAAVANTPDGLETGPGAQAAIERLIADYFAQVSDDGITPCVSEIRKRASRVMKAIEVVKPLLSKVA